MSDIENTIQLILNSGLSVAERENKGDCYDGNNHLTIIGGVRRVELYINGTIYANKVKNKFKKINIKGMHLNQAIERAIKIAKKGRY